MTEACTSTNVRNVATADQKRVENNGNRQRNDAGVKSSLNLRFWQAGAVLTAFLGLLAVASEIGCSPKLMPSTKGQSGGVGAAGSGGQAGNTYSL